MLFLASGLKPLEGVHYAPVMYIIVLQGSTLSILYTGATPHRAGGPCAGLLQMTVMLQLPAGMHFYALQAAHCL